MMEIKEDYTVNGVPKTNLEYFARMVFLTEDGKRLLQELKEKFLCQHVAPIGCDSQYPYYREGQNDLIRMFIKIAEVSE